MTTPATPPDRFGAAQSDREHTTALYLRDLITRAPDKVLRHGASVGVTVRGLIGMTGAPVRCARDSSGHDAVLFRTQNVWFGIWLPVVGSVSPRTEGGPTATPVTWASWSAYVRREHLASVLTRPQFGPATSLLDMASVIIECGNAGRPPLTALLANIFHALNDDEVEACRMLLAFQGTAARSVSDMVVTTH